MQLNAWLGHGSYNYTVEYAAAIRAFGYSRLRTRKLAQSQFLLEAYLPTDHYTLKLVKQSRNY